MTFLELQNMKIRPNHDQCFPIFILSFAAFATLHSFQCQKSFGISYKIEVRFFIHFKNFPDYLFHGYILCIHKFLHIFVKLLFRKFYFKIFELWELLLSGSGWITYTIQIENGITQPFNQYFFPTTNFLSGRMVRGMVGKKRPPSPPHARKSLSAILVTRHCSCVPVSHLWIYIDICIFLTM